ncbi:OmpA family protein [Rhodovulum strictum]|uniref:OmpA family protein n=1 Tax=Rhodovulum strictum TaxID=58314 RepID=A0A844B5J2_9RHOB|nr:OmpA family protein [Rhodovulum strictum]MRH19644.1 OmpA family protein [Rhodovulum strictum]
MRAKTPLIVAAAGALALAACTPTTTDTGDPRQRTKEGALIGAGLGAVTGMIVTDGGKRDARDALVGAAVGAAAGAAIGSGLDRQAADLRRDMGNDRINVVNTGSQLVVTMPQDILFAIDSAAVRPDLREDLRGLARNLNQYPNSTVDIIGHTDNTGSAAHNQDLSSRRAGAVAAVLTGSGVDPRRIRAFGRGEEQPIASNLTPEGRAQNRRVEIIIRPTN